jgi:serine/threonine protein phosphatase PrpC
VCSSNECAQVHGRTGIFDGHLGNIASKYAASAAYRVVEAGISNIDRDILSIPDWKEIVKSNLEQSFEEIHRGIISAVTTSPGGVMDESGTTATIVYVTDLSVIIANVGDSRAVLSQWTQDSRGRDILSAVQLTVDHIVSSHSEQELIAQRGGSVSRSGGIERVNGILAVSRSLGDISLAPFLSRSPHVLALTKTEVRGMCGAAAGQDKPCFLIAASDGLW